MILIDISIYATTKTENSTKNGTKFLSRNIFLNYSKEDKCITSNHVST